MCTLSLACLSACLQVADGDTAHDVLRILTQKPH